jgi:transposase InsO family protein
MDRDIEEMVCVCGPCATAAKQPFKATLHSWPPATKPWERIHIDYAGLHLGRHFLIIVDAYSKYLEVISMPNTISRQTVAILRKLCAQHGVPETIVSNNGMQITSYEFKEFCKAKAVSHILSPPYHPQSNGRAERLVDTFKRGLLKLRGEGDVDKILDTFLLAYRMTPSATLPQQRCPAQLFFGRKPRTTLDLLLPTKQPIGRDTKMERQFNRRHGAVEHNLNGGDPVYVRYRQSHDWMGGSVAKRIGGCLYDMTLANGANRRFHANQMRPGSTQLTDDEFMAFADAFNLIV